MRPHTQSPNWALQPDLCFLQSLAEQHPCSWAPLCKVLQGDLAPQAPLDAVAHPGALTSGPTPSALESGGRGFANLLPVARPATSFLVWATGPSWLPWCRPGSPV